MTQENKELLLKDLCARLPYGVKVYIRDMDYPETVQAVYSNLDVLVRDIRCYSLLWECFLYLRSMSTMTDEEKKELKQEHIKDEKLYAECLTKAANGDNSMRGKVIPHFAADWCDKHHFDYRGLIEKGLALEAPEGMYE